jgi:hypothetical protein
MPNPRTRRMKSTIVIEENVERVNPNANKRSNTYAARLEPAAVISKLDKVAVGIDHSDDQSQWFAEKGAASATCCVAGVEYRHVQDIADYYRLVVSWNHSVLKSCLPSYEQSLFLKVCGLSKTDTSSNSRRACSAIGSSVFSAAMICTRAGLSELLICGLP